MMTKKHLGLDIAGFPCVPIQGLDIKLHLEYRNLATWRAQ